jgi:hypothetical protein
VVGESYRQDTLRRVAGVATDATPYLDDLDSGALDIAETEDRSWFRAALIREPTNPVDPQAIAVHASGVGLVGYLSREDARRYGDVVKAAEEQGFAALSCPAMLSGGEAGKSFGVVLAISSPGDILDDLEEGVE